MSRKLNLMTKKLHRREATKLAVPGQAPTALKLSFTPASYSPLSTTSTRNVNDEAGKALCTFGRSQLITNCQWSQYRHGDINIKLSDIGAGVYMSQDTPYMTDIMSTRVVLELEELYSLGDQIIEHHKPKSSTKDQENDSQNSKDSLELRYCDLPCLEKIRCLGRIAIEDEKLEKYNIHLIDIDSTIFRKVRLDFGKCKNYSVFSGQVVLVEGYNLRGDTLIVDSIVSSINIISSPVPNLSTPLSIIVTSGPYTANNDLVYQPLSDLVNYCVDNPPDILILTGPILSSSNTAITQIAVKFDRHFEQMVAQIRNNINPNTHIIIASSFEDINSSYIYPTHPYRFKNNYQNLHMVPDPCIINVNGLQIGITSTDIIGHLSENEQTYNNGIDSIKRAVHYMFHQKSFYPIKPARVPLDVGLAAKYATLNVVPNVLILPSKMKEFIRDYNNCLCINPGKIYGTETGSFGRLVIFQPENETTKLYHYVAGQVIKI